MCVCDFYCFPQNPWVDEAGDEYHYDDGSGEYESSGYDPVSVEDYESASTSDDTYTNELRGGGRPRSVSTSDDIYTYTNELRLKSACAPGKRGRGRPRSVSTSNDTYTNDLSACAPGKRGRGRPRSVSTSDEAYKKRSSVYQKKKRRENALRGLEALRRKYGSPAKDLDAFVRDLLPNVAADHQVAINARQVLNSQKRSCGKREVVHSIYRGMSSRTGAGTANLPLETFKTYKYQKKPERPAFKLYGGSYPSNTTKDKTFLGEVAFTIDHAKEQMFQKSGANTAVWLLPVSFENLYLAYRRSYFSIVLKALKAPGGIGETSSKVLLNNIKLVEEGVVHAEPWTGLIKVLETRSVERKAANLPNRVNPRTIAYDATAECYIDVTHEAKRADLVAPSSSEGEYTVPLDDLHLKLQQDLAQSRVKNHLLRPRGLEAWKRFLKSDTTFRFRKITQPYPCDVCDNGPSVLRQLEDLQRRKQTLSPYCADYLIVNRQLLYAQGQVKKLERHHRQLANQRPYIRWVEDGLPPKDETCFRVVVFVDFVAQYNFRKKKVNNFIMTIKWRDEGGNLQYKYVNNVCSDESKSADAVYALTCWDAHLKPIELRLQLQKLRNSANLQQDDATYQDILAQLNEIERFDGLWDEFRGVTEIIRTGDNGGHLLNRMVMKWESQVYGRYGIIWRTHTLCKRHAYNLCDSHGSGIKKCIASYANAGYAPETAHDFSNIINHCLVPDISKDPVRLPPHRANAYPIQRVNRANKDMSKEKEVDGPLSLSMYVHILCIICIQSYIYIYILYLHTCTHTHIGIQAMCEFQYNYLDDEGNAVFMDNVVRMRELSSNSSATEAPYEVRYLVKGLDKAVWGTMCKPCSNEKSKPIFHKRDIVSGLQTVCKFKAGKCKGQMRSKIPSAPAAASSSSSSAGAAPAAASSSSSSSGAAPARAPGSSKQRQALASRGDRKCKIVGNAWERGECIFLVSWTFPGVVSDPANYQREPAAALPQQIVDKFKKTKKFESLEAFERRCIQKKDPLPTRKVRQKKNGRE